MHTIVNFDTGETVEVSALPPIEHVPTLDDYRLAIQRHIDATARQRGYDSGVTCASYVGSTNATWAAEAAALIAGRDAFWAHAYTVLARVEAGERAQPTVAEFIAELPAIGWPQ